jgi:uncharacterized membrane protein
MEHILPRRNKKMSSQERLLYGLAGGVLMAFGAFGIRRRSLLGGSVALAGADLLTKGATGHHLHEALGLADGHTGRGRASRIPHQIGVQVERSVLVNAGPEKAYEFVRNLENLPRFMEHVKQVNAISDKRSHWVVKAPAGTQVQWDAEIINDLPGELIAWRSINNPDVENAGSIHFERALRDRGTIIRVEMQYMPPAGVIGAAVAKLFGEEPEQQLKADLQRLKQIVETGEVATIEGQSKGGQHLRPAMRRRPANSEVDATSSSTGPAGLLTERSRAASAVSGRTH